MINTETLKQMVRRGTLDLGEVDEILSDIVRDDQRASEIIHRQGRLLKKGKGSDPQVFDLNDSVREVVDIIAPEAAKRGVALNADRTSEALPVRADRIQMQQVIINLAMNGMDALDDRDPAARKLTIQTSRNAKTGAEVTVTDSGKGIPDDRLKSIFDAFFTTKPHGTGLGLPIARTIVETYRGTIWAENSVGGGAAFHFTLPLTDTRSG